MIRVEQAPEPADFDAKVRQKGAAALLELIGDPAAPRRPGPRRRVVATRIEDIPANALPAKLWTAALGDLREAYDDTCAYLAMRIHPSTGAATVDHYKPKAAFQRDAFEWSNFRLASAQMNTNKGTHADVLDPFVIEDGWFVLNIGNFAVEANSALDPVLLEQVEATIERLGLNERINRDAREKFHDEYHGISPEAVATGESLPLWKLEAEAPFVARELRRQGRLRAGHD